MLTFKRPTAETPEPPAPAPLEKQAQTIPRDVDEKDVVRVGGLLCHRSSEWARWMMGE